MIILGIIVTTAILFLSMWLAIPMSYILSMCPDYEEWALMFIIIFFVGCVFIAEPAFSYSGIIIEGVVI